MYITFAVLALSVVFFVSGRIRSDVVALCALLLLMFFQILTPEEALSGFANPIVIMMVGLFVVGGAIFQTGLAKQISNKLLKLAGDSELRLLLLVILATAFIGAFISNTGTVALMLPIIVSLAASANISASRLLMPLAFASSMGGMLTLIGTPPNLVIDEALRSAGLTPLSFFSFTPVGIICIVTGIIILVPLSKLFLGKKGSKKEGKTGRKNKSMHDLASEYRLTNNLFRVKVQPKSPVIGHTVIDLHVRRTYNAYVLEIRRNSLSQPRLLRSVNQKQAADTVLAAGDILYLIGRFEDIQRFSEENNLNILSGDTSGNGNTPEVIDFYDIGLAEIVLMPSSGIINRTVGDLGFRDKYGVNVLGLRRKKEYILNDIQDEKFRSGDVLLVQGTWDDIARVSNEEHEWVVLGQPLEEASKVTLDYKAPVAAVIMVLMVATMAFDFIPVAPVTAVMGAAVLMVLTGCIKSVEAAYKTINWESIVLIAGMLPMSLALEKTGASVLISNSLVGGLGHYGPTVLLAGIYFTTSLMTMFISNTATAVLLTPIAMQAAISIEASPYPFLFAVAVSASMCFASPFSTPPNALVMPAGQYTFMDYIKVGLPLQIIMGIVMIFALPMLFPF